MSTYSGVYPIILTIPFGLLFKFFVPVSPVPYQVITAFMLGMSIETTQLILNYYLRLNRVFDVNDMLANGIGVIIGLVIFNLLKHKYGKILKSYQVYRT